MALIYEKLPCFVLEKTWDKKILLPKTYKLQSNDPCNKVKAEIHQVSGKFGIEFTVNKTIPEFEMGAEKNNLDWAHSFVEFKNVLQGQYKAAWKQVLHENFLEPDDSAMVPAEHNCSLGENFHCALEFFIKKALHKEKPQDRQYIYIMPGGNYNVKKKLVMSPIEYLH
jgi:hypothetical protein